MLLRPDYVYRERKRSVQAVAGASRVLISRECDEMPLPNLRAVGLAIRDLPEAGA